MSQVGQLGSSAQTLECNVARAYWNSHTQQPDGVGGITEQPAPVCQFSAAKLTFHFYCFPCSESYSKASEWIDSKSIQKLM